DFHVTGVQTCALPIFSGLLEASGQKQAEWRTDPARCGAAGGVGDLGTHAHNLAEYITGLKITELIADLTIFVEGRRLDDDANVRSEERRVGKEGREGR